MRDPATRILGTGHYLPPIVRTNADLERMVETSDEWIVERTGIRERRIAPDDVELTSVAYVTVDKDGKIGYLSYEVAESAGVTGFGSTLTLSLLGAVLIGLGLVASRRRTPAEA